MKSFFIVFFFIISCLVILGFNLRQNAPSLSIPSALAIRQNLKVDIKTLGDLEAKRSITIASSVKGDQGKIIDIIADGTYVQPDDVLIRLDPSPFEEKVEKLKGQIKEQKGYVKSLKHSLKWEIIQSKNKNRIAELELEAAQLELEKIKSGDGPQEIFRLKAAMQKALLKWDELKIYSKDLLELEKEGFLNQIETKQVEKRLNEEEEAYDLAKQQYDSYIQQAFPMMVKRAETSLKKAEINLEETAKGGHYTVNKSRLFIAEAQELLADLNRQLDEAKKELLETTIQAPSHGMVVLREEYRSSQKRKPRIGDYVLKNQPLIDLPDLSAMVMKTKVREADLFKVEIDKRSLIEVDAYPSMLFKGKVISIGILALAESFGLNDEKYFEVLIALEESDQKLRPGMTARATIEVEQVNGVVTIPIHAIYAEENNHYCYIKHPSQGYVKQKIELGISNQHFSEVKSGLSEGDVVCLVNPG